MRRYIEQLKEKPEHIRHRYAIGTAAGITGLVAVAWVVAHAATGTFALNPTPPEDGAASMPEPSSSSFSELLGAAGASFGGASSEPNVTVVDGETTSTIAPAPAAQTDATVIPF